MAYVPGVAALLAVNVSTLLPVVLLGLKAAVTPLDKPDADKFTLAVKPFCGTTVIVLVPFAPWKKLKLLGAAESVNLPFVFTVSAIVTELPKKPDIPLMVTLVTPTAAVALAVNVKVLVLVALAGSKVAVTQIHPEEVPYRNKVPAVEAEHD